MSIIINIKDNKIHPKFNECNICLQNKSKIQKCQKCEFYICNSCLIKWYKYNKKCPHCNEISTYKEPTTNVQNCNKCFKSIKKNITKLIHMINQIIKKISDIIISLICDEIVLDRLSKITICFGTSLFVLIYLSLYSLMIFLMITLVLFLIICTYHVCCCICCHNNTHCCYCYYIFL